MLNIKRLLLLVGTAVYLGCGGTAGNKPALPAPPTSPGTESATAHSKLIAPDLATIDRLFPGAVQTREFTDPFPYLGIYDSCGILLGFQAESNHAGTTESGFSGPVPVRVFLDTLARVLSFEVLANDETPAYLRLACDSLAGRLTHYRSGEKGNIDAVSLATLSSRAIIAGVTGIADRIAKEVVPARLKGD